MNHLVAELIKVINACQDMATIKYLLLELRCVDGYQYDYDFLKLTPKDL